MLFGPDEYCSHGTKGSDGVCMDCCNDLFGPDDDGDGGDGGEVIDFPRARDMV